jgi:hypothetical protein
VSAVKAELIAGGFETLYGKVTFDSNGQYANENLVVQYVPDGTGVGGAGAGGGGGTRRTLAQVLPQGQPQILRAASAPFPFQSKVREKRGAG